MISPGFDRERERLELARELFGLAMIRWRKQNRWAQDTLQRWGEAVGTPHVYGSQWSHFEHGTSKDPNDPSSMLSTALGFQNTAIAHREFHGLKGRTLIKKLSNAIPVTHADKQSMKCLGFLEKLR